VTEQLHDLAHIGHAELLTPFPDDSLRFFVELFGMEVEHREGQSVFLRGWGDYQRYSLKLTEAPLPGMGHMALRAWSPEALERRVAAIEATGLGRGWTEGDHGHGPAYQFADPDGHAMELYYETERYEPPAELRPRLKNVPQRYVGRGAAVKRLDHVNLLAKDIGANRGFALDQLGFRLYEQIINDDGTEVGAWMSLTIAAHELIYVLDSAGANGRLHHFAFFVDTREEVLRAADLMLDADVPIEAAPSKHAVAQGMFLYVYEPGGNRVEVTTGTHFIYDPDYPPVVWTQAERARGQAWGVKTISTFHTYGTPDISGEATGPPIPPTSRIPSPNEHVPSEDDPRAPTVPFA
jgi:catechol 2,3-dioxygenase